VAWDRAAVEALLVSEGLPLAGVAEHLLDFFAAEDAGNIVGSAGLEVHARCGLLRSVVVASGYRSQRVGYQLVQRVVEDATERGLAALYLLTTTAPEYFSRLGFERLPRDAMTEPLFESAELRGACPVSAIAMCRQL
jgi:N-acetylglutamate synthase-like GNAT family acetyltransferase